MKPSSLLLLLLASVFATTGAYLSKYGPSPVEYGILQLPSLGNSSHNLVLGWRQYGDRLVHREVVKRSSQFMRVTVADIRFPNFGYVPQNITHVLARDLFSGSSGGYANLTAGGVGFHMVGLRFKSQRSYGLKFMVEIYGK